MIDQEDFSVVVKKRANPPKPWRWEIYRAGKAALKLMLSEFQS
jgi:hypothetical protein